MSHQSRKTNMPESHTEPCRSDSLALTHVQATSSSMYKISNLPKGAESLSQSPILL